MGPPSGPGPCADVELKREVLRHRLETLGETAVEEAKPEHEPVEEEVPLLRVPAREKEEVRFLELLRDQQPHQRQLLLLVLDPLFSSNVSTPSADRRRRSGLKRAFVWHEATEKGGWT